MNSDDCLLATTGADFVGPVGLALGLLVLGVVIVLLARTGRGLAGPLVLVALLAMAVFSLNSPARAHADDGCEESTSSPSQSPSATASATPTGSATATATATATPTTEAIDLSLAGEPSTIVPQVGVSFSYTLLVDNATSVDSLAGVQIFVPTVAGIATADFGGVGWTLSGQDAAGATYEYSAVIPAGQSAEPLVLTLVPQTAGAHTLEANIVAGSGGDTVVSNNPVSASITAAVPTSPDLTISVGSSVTNISAGDTVAELHYQVRNIGSASTAGTTTVVIAKHDAQLHEVLAVPSGWTLLSENEGSFVFSTTETLLPGYSADFTIAYFTELAPPSGFAAFSGAVSTPGDADSSNDTDLLTVPVVIR